MREKNSSGSSFFAGFVMGFLVALLFTTKKGRNILKTLTEEGKQVLEELLESNRDDMPSTDGDEDEVPEKNIPARKGILRHLRKN